MTDDNRDVRVVLLVRSTPRGLAALTGDLRQAGVDGEAADRTTESHGAAMDFAISAGGQVAAVVVCAGGRALISRALERWRHRRLGTADVVDDHREPRGYL